MYLILLLGVVVGVAYVVVAVTHHHSILGFIACFEVVMSIEMCFGGIVPSEGQVLDPFQSGSRHPAQRPCSSKKRCGDDLKLLFWCTSVVVIRPARHKEYQCCARRLCRRWQTADSSARWPDASREWSLERKALNVSGSVALVEREIVEIGF